MQQLGKFKQNNETVENFLTLILQCNFVTVLATRYRRLWRELTQATSIELNAFLRTVWKLNEKK